MCYKRTVLPSPHRRFVATILTILLTSASLHVITQGIDLDRFDDARLERDLVAEMDDVYDDLAPDGDYPLDDLKDALLEALGDEGDDDDDLEEEVTLKALQDEMAEADTTLEDVVDEAVEAADAVAARGSRAWSIVRVAAPSSLTAQRRGNGRTTPRQAVLQATRAIIRTSNAR